MKLLAADPELEDNFATNVNVLVQDVPEGDVGEGLRRPEQVQGSPRRSISRARSRARRSTTRPATRPSRATARTSLRAARRRRSRSSSTTSSTAPTPTSSPTRPCPRPRTATRTTSRRRPPRSASSSGDELDLDRALEGARLLGAREQLATACSALVAVVLRERFTYMPTKRSVSSGSRPRPNFIAYSSACGRCSSPASIDSASTSESSLERVRRRCRGARR